MMPRNRDNLNAWRRANYADRKRWIDSLKDKPCADCGQSYPPIVMDFDHKDPAQKLFAVSIGGRLDKESVLAEVAKCDVVCANCHRLRTLKQIQAGTRPQKTFTAFGKRTLCTRGHAYNEENTRVFTDRLGRTSRACRACDALRARARRAARSANTAGLLGQTDE